MEGKILTFFFLPPFFHSFNNFQLPFKGFRKASNRSQTTQTSTERSFTDHYLVIVTDSTSLDTNFGSIICAQFFFVNHNSHKKLFHLQLSVTLLELAEKLPGKNRWKQLEKKLSHCFHCNFISSSINYHLFILENCELIPFCQVYRHILNRKAVSPTNL